MSDRPADRPAKVSPGVSRENRISDEGLDRLEKQLKLGIKIATPVLQQWVRRYGKPARKLLKSYGYNLQD